MINKGNLAMTVENQAMDASFAYTPHMVLVLAVTAAENIWQHAEPVPGFLVSQIDPKFQAAKGCSVQCVIQGTHGPG